MEKDYGAILEKKYGENWLSKADEIAKTQEGKDLLNAFWKQINEVH